MLFDHDHHGKARQHAGHARFVQRLERVNGNHGGGSAGAGFDARGHLARHLRYRAVAEDANVLARFDESDFAELKSVRRF